MISSVVDFSDFGDRKFVSIAGIVEKIGRVLKLKAGFIFVTRFFERLLGIMSK